jgi:hypothetical protein
MNRHRRQDFLRIMETIKSHTAHMKYDNFAVYNQVVVDLDTLMSRLDEKCEGYCNRETFAADMFINNSEWANKKAKEILATTKKRYTDKNGETYQGQDLTVVYGKELRNWMEAINEKYHSGRLGSFAPMHRKDVKDMWPDIGSIWRVDWYEIAESQMQE